MHRRGIVDAIPQEPDHVSATAQGGDDALLLRRIEFRKHLRAFGQTREGLLGHRRDDGEQEQEHQRARQLPEDD
jgi:hypothetical protein